MDKKNWVLFVTSSFLIACSDGKSVRYQDTSHLEVPPKMEIVEKPKIAVEEQKNKVNAGLGDSVLMTGSASRPVLKVKKLFDRSWNIVEQALKLSKIEITDKNRDEGVFYVLFDPDAQAAGDSSIVDNMTFFLFTDEYEESAYKLTLKWRDSDTQVTAERIDQESNDMLEDDEDIEEFEGSVDEGSQLIRVLYQTIRDDLPVD